MTTFFEPADLVAHAAANRGQDVTDRCRNCGMDFMEHRNGRCPEEAEEEAA